MFLEKAPFLDLCRPGYALYGGNPTPGSDNPMRRVVALSAVVLQVRGGLREGEALLHDPARRGLPRLQVGEDAAERVGEHDEGAVHYDECAYCKTSSALPPAARNCTYAGEATR